MKPSKIMLLLTEYYQHKKLHVRVHLRLDYIVDMSIKIISLWLLSPDLQITYDTLEIMVN